MNRRTALSAADWLLPPNLFRLLTYYYLPELKFFFTHRSVLAANKSLCNRHAGERCFILCNGPSVKRQNIRPLREEIVFSVSSGFNHPEFAFVRPRYHCVPQLTFKHLTPPIAANWFREMDDLLNEAELFLATQEYDFVKRNNLFPNRSVYFLCLGRRYFPKRAPHVQALTGIVTRASTVPVMAMTIALYMGFKTIYLLGTDHDWFVTKRYEYFYDRSKVRWKDETVNADGTLSTSLLDELPYVRNVWEQYHAVKEIAATAGVRVYNATDGGMLDVFERVNLEDVLASTNR